MDSAFTLACTIKSHRYRHKYMYREGGMVSEHCRYRYRYSYSYRYRYRYRGGEDAFRMMQLV